MYTHGITQTDKVALCYFKIKEEDITISLGSLASSLWDTRNLVAFSHNFNLELEVSVENYKCC